MSLSSCFRYFSLAELFQLFEKERQSGCLTVSNFPSHQALEAKSYYIWFREGRVVAAANSCDSQGLLSKILERGWLSEQVIEKLCSRAFKGKPLGLHLKTEGAIGSEQLNLLFNSQIHQVRELFESYKVAFKLDSKAPLPWSEMTGFSLGAIEVALMALRKLKNWQVLADTLPDSRSTIQTISENQPHVSLNTLEYQVWNLAKGNVSLDAIASGLNQSITKVQQAAFRLIIADLVAEIPLWAFTADLNQEKLTKLAEQLRARGYFISERKVPCLLHQLGYNQQNNLKIKQVDSPPEVSALARRRISPSIDRSLNKLPLSLGEPHEFAQFQHIHDLVQDFLDRDQPVISVDTQKKEVIGECKENDQFWQRKKQPIEVNTQGVPEQKLAKVVPHGIDDLGANQAWVNVGINDDTAEFAVESIRRWWQNRGKQMYPDATELLITADCGSNNEFRLRLWKTQLKKLAHESGLKIQVAHLPSVISKWNNVENRMFYHITGNWKGRLLSGLEVVINPIGNTTLNNQRLLMKAQLDKNKYVLGKTV